MKLFFIPLFVFLLILNNSLAQDPTSPTKNFSIAEAIPPSPTAYSFAKYGDIPVAFYTGAASFSVPIWTVNGTELSTPIILNYHGGGIKVQEEASWVGLGWNLSLGGTITRNTRGLADEFADYSYGNFQTSGDPAMDQNFLRCVLQKHCDAELDVFVFNIGGHSGKFVVNNGTPHLLAYEDLKISVSGGPTLGAAGPFSEYSFEITDEKGVRYSFGSGESVHYTEDNLSKAITNAWYVTQIRSANGLDTINFNYGVETMYRTIVGGQSYSSPQIGSNTACGKSSTSSTTTASTTTAQRLMSIESRSQKVTFKEQTTTRPDFQTPTMSYALDSILVVDKSNNSTIKKFKLNYAPFGSVSYLSKRLTLLQLDEISRDNTQKLTHTFSYNGIENLPPKNSFAQDHWGYYNGSIGNASLIPSSANREPNAQYNQSGLLNKITYPTGGSTEIEYESNNYSLYGAVPITEGGSASAYASSTTGDVVTDSNIFQVGTSGAAGPFTANVHMLLFLPGTGIYQIDDESSITKVQVNHILPNGTEEILLRYFRTKGGTLDTVITMSLDTGRYRVIANSPILNSVATISLSWVELSTTEMDWIEYTGPGARVKSVTEYPMVSGVPAVKKSYDYSSAGTGKSSGVITGNPLNYHSTSYSQIGLPDNPSVCIDCYYDVVSSTSKFAALPSPDYQIFYSEVSEKIEGGKGNGKTTYIYEPTENGDARLITKTDYKSMGGGYSPVTVQTNSYASTNDNSFSGIVINSTSTYACINPRQECTTSVYNVYSDWNHIATTYETMSNYPNSYTEQSTYTFGNNHRYPIQIDLTASDGKTQTKKLKYPNDYVSSVSGALVNNHVTGVPVEQQEWVTTTTGSSVTAGTVTEYDQTLLKPIKLHQLEIASPANSLNNEITSSGKFTSLIPDTNYKQRASIGYDPVTGQVTTQAQTNNVSHSYIYDYLKSKPIAHVVNASPDQIAYTSFESSEKGNWNFSGVGHVVSSAPTGLKVYSLSSSSVTRSSLIAATSYVLSFWYSNGSSIQVNGGVQSSITNSAAVNGWALSQRIVTGTTSISISGTGDIDEVRIYPVNAQMTSYTYDPLVGVTSSTDANNVTTYYEYDNFNRLRAIRDQYRNILKSNSYHVKGQN